MGKLMSDEAVLKDDSCIDKAKNSAKDAKSAAPRRGGGSPASQLTHSTARYLRSTVPFAHIEDPNAGTRP